MPNQQATKRSAMLMTKVSETWLSFIEKNSCHTTFTEMAENIENALPEYEAHTIRLTESDSVKITELANEKNIAFDDVVNDLIQKAYDLRFNYRFKTTKEELIKNIPRNLDKPKFSEGGEEFYQSHTILFNRELLHKTCTVGRKRTNDSNGEMPIKMTIINDDDGKREYFQFFMGSTVRLVLANYSFFESKQALIKASELKHAQ